MRGGGGVMKVSLVNCVNESTGEIINITDDAQIMFNEDVYNQSNGKIINGFLEFSIYDEPRRMEILANRTQNPQHPADNTYYTIENYPYVLTTKVKVIGFNINIPPPPPPPPSTAALPPPSTSAPHPSTSPPPPTAARKPTFFSNPFSNLFSKKKNTGYQQF